MDVNIRIDRLKKGGREETRNGEKNGGIEGGTPIS